MSQAVVIYGFGGLGRELLGWLKNEADRTLFDSVVAFVDEDPSKAGLNYAGLPVLTPAQALERHASLAYLCAVANPRARAAIVARLVAPAWEALSYVHSSVLLGLHVTLGLGSIVLPRCSISSDVTVGEFVIVNGGTGLGHDTRIGNYVTLLGGCAVNGDVKVEDYALLGANCVIHPSKRIGEGAIVGIGSVVIGNVKPGMTVFGNPAKSLG